MKKAAILLGSVLIGSGSLLAQSQENKAPMAIKPALIEKQELNREYRGYNQNSQIESAATTTTFWSEDFSNGIPSTWQQNGSTALSAWEYRGPSTTPSNTTGSRGAWAQGTGPIVSPTAGNGFVIFDSDFLDNAGSQTNPGSGVAPAPHIGRLLTDTIDLSGETAVELRVNSYARQFFSRYFIAFSKDAGQTWNDTIELYEDLEVNTDSDDDGVETFNVSGYIGGEAQAMIQFIYAGNKPGNTNGTGYYYWMLDDIELRSLPENAFRFTEFNGAPPQDITFNGNPSYTKYGVMNDDQIVPINFDANVYNYGSVTQTNIKLEVEIYDGNGGLVTTVSSPAGASLPMLDTLDFNTLTTPSWTPTAVDEYTFIYKITSDSLSVSTTNATDTVNFSVRENNYGVDWGTIDNFFGTTSAVGDMVAAGTRYALENEDSDSTGSGLVFLDGVDIYLSTRTDSTADLEISLFDTAGFAFNAGFPAGTTPVFTRTYTLNANSIGGLIRFPFSTVDSVYDNGNWTEVELPLTVPTGTYFVIVNFFPNAAGGVVRIANSAQYFQPSESAVFQTGDGDWFGGFLNSTTFEAPIIRLAVADAPRYDVSISENDINRFSVYPNPTNGEGSVAFHQGGTYSLNLIDMVGRVHYSDEVTVNENERREFNFNDLKPGVYLLQIEGEGLNKTIKLQVQ